MDTYETPKARCNIFEQEIKSMNTNVRHMDTLEVNFEWENMSDASMDSEEFEDVDETSDV